MKPEGVPTLYKIIIEKSQDTCYTDYVIAMNIADAVLFLAEMYGFENLTIENVISAEQICEDFNFTDEAKANILRRVEEGMV